MCVLLCNYNRLHVCCLVVVVHLIKVSVLFLCVVRQTSGLTHHGLFNICLISLWILLFYYFPLAVL